MNQEIRDQVRKLEESRPHARCPHACDYCAKSHRRCEFNERPDRCDKCISKGLQCSFTPRAMGPGPEDGDRTTSFSRGADSPSTARAYPQYRSGVPDHRVYSSGSSEGSPVQGGMAYSPVSPTHPQSAAGYSYHPQVATHPSRGMEAAFPAPQAYPPFDASGGDARQGTGSRGAVAQARGSSAYYAAAGAQTQQLSPGAYGGGGAQWGGYAPQAQQQQPQSAPPTAGQAYASQAAMYPGAVQPPMQRQLSAPAAQAQSNVSPQTYQTQGRAYLVQHGNMYQQPQDGRQETVASIYSPGSGYGAQGQMDPDTGATDAYSRQHRGNMGQ